MRAQGAVAVADESQAKVEAKAKQADGGERVAAEQASKERIRCYAALSRSVDAMAREGEESQERTAVEKAAAEAKAAEAANAKAAEAAKARAAEAKAAMAKAVAAQTAAAAAAEAAREANVNAAAETKQAEGKVEEKAGVQRLAEQERKGVGGGGGHCADKCAGCNEPVPPGAMRAVGKSWHNACFACAGCRLHILAPKTTPIAR